VQCQSISSAFRSSSRANPKEKTRTEVDRQARDAFVASRNSERFILNLLAHLGEVVEALVEVQEFAVFGRSSRGGRGREGGVGGSGAVGRWERGRDVYEL